MANTIAATKVISGTYGYIWVDDVPIYEITGGQAKVAKQKEDVNMCGAFMIDQKCTNGKGTGNIDAYRVFSPNDDYMAKMKEGTDVRYTIVMALKDPDAYGFERVALYNCGFDDLTLADFKAGSSCSVSRPFTFTDWEFLDKIERRV